jgi:hypothetical protein
MPTFLVTKQMSAALSARVHASVLGRRIDGAPVRGRRAAAILRVLALGVLLLLTGSFVSARHRAANRLAATRAELLRRVREASSALARAQTSSLGQLEASFGVHAAGAYPGDWIAAELRTDAALAERLRVPTVYLRGPLDGLSTSAAVAQSAAASTKDALMLCLVSPPPSRTEKALRERARAAYGGRVDPTTGVAIERLEPLLQTLPLLAADWERRISSAKTQLELAQFQTQFDRAPLRAAMRAATARQVLLAVDEPSDVGGPTELDGERAHFARVVLYDLSGRLSFRIRKRVDPSWISAAGRAEYASGIDSCSLALDARTTIVGVEPAPRDPAIPAPEQRRKGPDRRQ